MVQISMPMIIAVSYLASLFFPRPLSTSPASSSSNTRRKRKNRRYWLSVDLIGYNMRRLRDEEDNRSDEGIRARKQRKQRPCFSCAGESAECIHKLSLPLFYFLCMCVCQANQRRGWVTGWLTRAKPQNVADSR